MSTEDIYDMLNEGMEEYESIDGAIAYLMENCTNELFELDNWDEPKFKEKVIEYEGKFYKIILTFGQCLESTNSHRIMHWDYEYEEVEGSKPIIDDNVKIMKRQLFLKSNGMEKIKIKKDCTTCLFQPSLNTNNRACSVYCKNFSIHDFTCEYCIHKLPEGDSHFCEMENEDGSQNCFHGDHFEFNHLKYEIIKKEK